MVESYSEGEEDSISTLRRLPSCGNVTDDTTAPVAAVEIRSLIERKEELERRQRKQDRHRQRVQVSAKYPIAYTQSGISCRFVDVINDVTMRRHNYTFATLLRCNDRLTLR